jgi:hypothetical protein
LAAQSAWRNYLEKNSNKTPSQQHLFMTTPKASPAKSKKTQNAEDLGLNEYLKKRKL